MWAADTVYKTALFGSSYNSKGVSGYTGVSFDATNSGFKVNVANFNNNNNGWSVIKCGGKKGAYTGTIITDAVIDKAITKVALTIDAITSSNVTSIKLYTSSNKSSWTEAGSFDKSTGAKEVTLTSPTANLYYKIEIVCTQGDSNGLVTISKIDYYYSSTVDLTNEELAWSGSSYTATIGASNTFPTLTNTQGVTVSYQSTNEDAATIDSDGNISLVAAGETTIKAVFAGNSTYNAKTVSYDLTVLAAGAVAAPTFNTDNGASVELGTEVTINAPSNDCTLKYQIGDGEVVNVNTYTANVTMNTVGAVTLKAWAVKNATDSDPAQISLTVTKHPITPSFAPASVDVVRGNNVAAPDLSGNTGSGTVTYASGDTDIATVDENTGEVTGVAVGSTTITATIAATATYLGNTATFTVNVTKPTHTVTFYCNGSTVSSASVAEGSAITFPTAAATPSAGQIPETYNGKTFIGWYTDEYTHATDAPAYVNSANMGDEDIPYYAVYAEVSGSAGWVEATLASMTSTDVFVFASGTYAMKNDGGTSGSPKPANITVADGKITSTVTDAMKWKVTGNGTDGYTFLKADETTKWLYCNTTASSSSNDNLRVGTGDRKLWVYSGSYLVTNDTYTDRYLSMNGTTDFRSYINTNTNPITPKFYKYQGPTYSNFTTDARAEAGIVFAEVSIDAQLSGDYAGQALTNPNELTVAYSSSDENVATVNASTGAITEKKKAGTTTITATFAGNASYKPGNASYTLNVTEKTPAGLTYAVTEVEKTAVDDNFTNALGNPNNLAGVTYGSSNTGVATIDEDGEVTVKAVGETTITASFAGNATYAAGNASYTLTVSKATPTLSFASANITGHIGESVSANTLTNPANLTVSYSSSDETVATVNSTSGVVANPLKAGTTTITATFTGNDTYVAGNASYTLKVLANPTISVSDDDVDFGKTYTFDDSALSSYGAVTLTSGNENIATVSGLVITPVACGTVTITVSTAENEDYRDGQGTFDLTINAPAGATTSDELITTLDFTDNTSWDLPTSETSTTTSYDNGDYEITLAGAHYFQSTNKYLMLRSGGSLTFPTFDKKVNKIKVVGNSGASTKTKENIYVDEAAVSTETTGSTSTNTFNINSNYQTVGTTYELQVSTANAQITSIEVYTTPAAATVTLNKYGYATFCSQYPMDFTSTTGYTAWRVNNVAKDGTITFKKITEKIKGGQGVLLYNKNADGVNTSNVTVNFADGSTVFTSSENLLVGTTAATYITTTNGDYTNFGLKGNEFIKANDGVLPANKAYLPIETSLFESGARLSIVFDDEDEATGIKNVNHEDAINDRYYNINGLQVEKPKKGLYIVNGRKVVVK